MLTAPEIMGIKINKRLDIKRLVETAEITSIVSRITQKPWPPSGKVKAHETGPAPPPHHQILTGGLSQRKEYRQFVRAIGSS